MLEKVSVQHRAVGNSGVAFIWWVFNKVDNCCWPTLEEEEVLVMVYI